MFLIRFNTYKIASPPQTKMTSKDNHKGLVSLKFLHPCLGLLTRYTTVLIQPKIKYRNTPFTYCITEIKITTLASVGTIKIVVKDSAHCAQITVSFAFLECTTPTFKNHNLS
jgi:hypothetical protein